MTEAHPAHSTGGASRDDEGAVFGRAPDDLRARMKEEFFENLNHSEADNIARTIDREFDVVLLGCVKEVAFAASQSMNLVELVQAAGREL